MKYSTLNRLSILCALILFLAVSVPAQKPMFSFNQTGRWRVPYASDFEKALYKGTMDIAGNHLTGLVLVKRMNDTTFRIVFTNEVGMTYFDLELLEHSMTVKSVFPSMNRKAFLSVLEDDLRMIFFKDRTFRKMTTRDHCNEDSTSFYQTSSNRGNWNYTVNCHTLDLLRIASSGKSLKKTLIWLRYQNDGIPSEISISNPNIRHTFHLALLSR